MPFYIVREDIVKMKTEAIVNTANAEPLYGTGIDSAVYRGAGEEYLLNERKKIGRLSAGEVAVTGGGALEAKYILHAVSPRWIDGLHGETELLRKTYRNALEKLRELGVRSAAFPLIGAGNNGYAPGDVIRTALGCFTDFLLEHPMELYLVVFRRESYEIANMIVAGVRAYIDEHYVADAMEQEYGWSRGHGVEELRRFREERMQQPMPEEKKGGNPYVERLFQRITDSGKKDSEIYKAAGLSSSVFYHMRTQPDYLPEKRTAFALCFPLKLSPQEAEELLALAGLGFAKNNPWDQAIRFYLETKQYDTFEVDADLCKKGLKPLFSRAKDAAPAKK